jgi:hypothetical protein
VVDQWLRMLSKCFSDQTTHVHLETSTFETSGLRAFAGGETPKVKNLRVTSLIDVELPEWLPHVT